MRKLYIKNAEKFTTLEELIKFGFSEYGGKFSPTYHDSACEKPEDNWKRRSLEDLLAVSRGYFPETSEEELCKLLVKLFKEWHLRSHWCPNIKKVVFVADGVADSFYAYYRSMSSIEGEGETKGLGEYDIIQIHNFAGEKYPLKR